MRCKLTIFIILSLVLTAKKSKSQANDFRKQRRELVLFNVGFNSLISGIGALVNKQPNEQGGKIFLKGFYKGMLGGTISHLGLTMTSLVRTQESIAFAWPARIVNAIGSSMIQNAAENRKLFERLHFNLFVTRLDYYPYSQKFSARLFTSCIYGLIITSRNAKLDIGKSLGTGIFYFGSDQLFSNSLVTANAIAQVSSIGMANSFTGQRFYDIFAHEVAHILQYDRKVGGNALLYKPDSRWKQSFKFYRTLSKYIYFDLNGPIFWLAYRMEGLTHNCNLFEQEAENYSGARAYKCQH